MDTPPPIPTVELDTPTLDVFGAVFKLMRLLAIACALLFAGAGGLLAWNFFYFVTDIIREPGQTVQRWQTAMAPLAQQDLFAPVAPVFKTTPEPLSSVPPTTPAPETASSPNTTPAAPTEAPTEATVPPVAPEAVPIDAAPLPTYPQENQDTALWLNFANSVLDRFQAGHFSWLLGMGFLALFCWVLGKIPGVMITAGARVLVDLLNYEKA